MRRTSRSSRPFERRHVLPVHEHVAAVGLQQPDDVLQRHALAGAAPAEQAERRALRHVERDVVEHLAIVERLGHALELDGGLTVGRRRWFMPSPGT